MSSPFPGTPISGLPVAVNLDGTEQVALVQNDTTKRATVDQINAHGGGGGGGLTPINSSSVLANPTGATALPIAVRLIPNNLTFAGSSMGLADSLVVVSSLTVPTANVTTLNARTANASTLNVSSVANITAILNVVGTATFTGRFGVIGTSTFTGVTNILGTTVVTGSLTFNNNVFYPAATEAAVRAAALAASVAGGGVVILPAASITLTQALEIYSGVSYIGTSYQASYQGGQTATLGGTTFVGDGTFNGADYDAVDLVTPPSDFQVFTAACVNGFVMENITFVNFLYGVKIGALYAPGALYSRFRNLSFINCQQWGFWIENYEECTFERLNAMNCQVGGVIGLCSAGGAAWNGGNSEWYHCTVTMPSRAAHAMALWARASSAVNQDTFYSCETNKDTLSAISQAATMANLSANITVTDGTQFPVDMPVTVSASVNGFVTNTIYFVASVAGNVITLRNTVAYGSAITATGNTAVNVRTYGRPCLEICGLDAGSFVTSFTSVATDLEGSCTARVLLQNVTHGHIVPSGLIGGTEYITYCLRGTTYSRFGDLQGGSTVDADAATSANNWYEIAITDGFLSKMENLSFDSAANAVGWNNNVFLTGESAGQLAQRNGTNAQSFGIYNTYTDGTNYESGGQSWQAVANVLTYGTFRGASAGSSRPWQFYYGSAKVFDYGVTTPSTFNFIGNTDFSAKVTLDGAGNLNRSLALINQYFAGNAVGSTLITLNSGVSDYGAFGQSASGEWGFGGTTNGTTNHLLSLKFDTLGNASIGLGAISTSATDGFGYMPTSAGVPTGTPTAKSGFAPFQYDTTNSRLYVYNSAWISPNTFTGIVSINGTVNLTGTLNVVGTATFTGGTFGVNATSNFTGIHGVVGTSTFTGTHGIIGTTLVTGLFTNVGTAQFTGGSFGVNATANFTGIFSVNGTANFTSNLFTIVGTTNITGGAINFTTVAFNVNGTATFTAAQFGVTGTTNFTANLFTVVGTANFTGGAWNATAVAFNVNGTTTFTAARFGVIGTALFTANLFSVVGTSQFTGVTGIAGTTNITGFLTNVGTAQFTGGSFLVNATTNFTGIFSVVGTTLFTSGTFGIVGTTLVTGIVGIVGSSILTGTLTVSGTTVLTNVGTGVLIANAGIVTSAGGMVLLATLSPSGVASTNNTTVFTSAYRSYWFVIDNLCPATNTAILQMTVCTTGSAFTTASYVGIATVNMSALSVTDITTAGFLLTGTRGTTAVGTSTVSGVNGVVQFYNPSSSVANKQLTGQLSYVIASSVISTATLALVSANGIYSSASPVTGVNFVFSTGNIATGTIKIFGLT